MRSLEKVTTETHIEHSKNMAIGNDVIHTLDIVLGCQKPAGDENLGPHHSGKGFLKQQKAADR